ncbi:MAG: hypothetical protein WAK89_05840 [Candidatus Sulfotelmatobacter sp.]
MKSLWRLSSFVAFAVLLSCLPCALGQSATNIKATRAAQSVLNYAPPSLFAFAFTSGNDLYNNNGKGGKGGNGGYGNGGYGNGGNGGGCGYSDSKAEKCAAVPEGGTPLMYLLLAGLSCLGAMVLRSRRQGSMPQTN